MPTTSFLDDAVLSPLGTIGRGTLSAVCYLGGLGTLASSAVRSALRPGEDDPPFVPTVTRHLASVLGMGLPLVGLVHVGLGSFLSMQAYFGGTFVDGTGAVVGVGLVRNVAPLMTGLTLAGLFAAWTTSELRSRSSRELDADPRRIPDRVTRPQVPAALTRGPAPGRLAAVRLASALVAGPVLTLWGAAVGTLVGWKVAHTILGVSTSAFFDMFFEMIWIRDVVGLVVKGMAFALLAALFACHEGLRGEDPPAPERVRTAACRAACLAAAAMLLLNSGWFLLVYHAGPAFGPTLLAPPSS